MCKATMNRLMEIGALLAVLVCTLGQAGAAELHVVSSGGFAAATNDTAGGSWRSPTSRSSTTRSIAACTDGDAVVSSSRNTTVSARSTQRVAHRGGAKMTEPPSRIGSPAKSDASRTLPTTTSHGRPS